MFDLKCGRYNENATASICSATCRAFSTMLHLGVLRDHMLYIIHNIKLENRTTASVNWQLSDIRSA